MKTKVRTTESASVEFRTMRFDILDKKHPKSETLEKICTLCFQCNVGETRWYGLSYQLVTFKPEDLLKMARIAKFIHAHSDSDAQPTEIKLLIGAEHGFYRRRNLELTGERYDVHIHSSLETMISTLVDTVKSY